MHQVIFYPVGNGDTTQIILSGGRRVLFDFCHRDKAEMRILRKSTSRLVSRTT